MGCLCSKSSAVEENNESISKKLQSSTSELNVLRLNSSKRVEGGVNMKVKASFNEKKSNGSVHLTWQ
jgi:cyclin-dependent kinase 12/13